MPRGWPCFIYFYTVYMYPQMENVCILLHILLWLTSMYACAKTTFSALESAGLAVIVLTGLWGCCNLADFQSLSTYIKSQVSPIPVVPVACTSVSEKQRVTMKTSCWSSQETCWGVNSLSGVLMITQVSFPHGPGGSPPGRGGGKEHGVGEEVKKRDKRAWWHIKESFNININHRKPTTLTEPRGVWLSTGICCLVSRATWIGI